MAARNVHFSKHFSLAFCKGILRQTRHGSGELDTYVHELLRVRQSQLIPDLLHDHLLLGLHVCTARI
jgi:hypothetical protein